MKGLWGNYIKICPLQQIDMYKKLDKMFENDFLRVPRPFVRIFNLNTAVMLSEIYSEYTYWKNQNRLENGGWFFSTVENMFYQTGLSKHQQLVACKELVSSGIIKVKYHGLPKKRYFKFNMNAVDKLYVDFNDHLYAARGVSGQPTSEENHRIVSFVASF